MKYQSTYVRDVALRARANKGTRLYNEQEDTALRDRADEGYVWVYNEPEDVWESAMK